MVYTVCSDLSVPIHRICTVACITELIPNLVSLTFLFFFFFLEISFDISAKHAINSAMGNFYRFNMQLNISSLETGHGVVTSAADIMLLFQELKVYKYTIFVYNVFIARLLRRIITSASNHPTTGKRTF